MTGQDSILVRISANEWMNEWASNSHSSSEDIELPNKHNQERNIQRSHPNNFTSCLVNYNSLHTSTFHRCVKSYHILSSLCTWRHCKSVQYHRERLGWTGVHPPKREGLNMQNLRKRKFHFSPLGKLFCPNRWGWKHSPDEFLVAFVFLYF